MNGIPVIKIELEGMKQSISTALMARSGEFDKMIQIALDKSFNVETIQHKIDMQVAKALDDAIDTLSEHYLVKALVRDIVVKSLTNTRDKTEKDKS